MEPAALILKELRDMAFNNLDDDVHTAMAKAPEGIPDMVQLLAQLATRDPGDQPFTPAKKDLGTPSTVTPAPFGTATPEPLATTSATPSSTGRAPAWTSAPLPFGARPLGPPPVVSSPFCKHDCGTQTETACNSEGTQTEKDEDAPKDNHEAQADGAPNATAPTEDDANEHHDEDSWWQSSREWGSAWHSQGWQGHTEYRGHPLDFRRALGTYSELATHSVTELLARRQDAAVGRLVVAREHIRAIESSISLCFLGLPQHWRGRECHSCWPKHVRVKKADDFRTGEYDHAGGSIGRLRDIYTGSREDVPHVLLSTSQNIIKSKVNQVERDTYNRYLTYLTLWILYQGRPKELINIMPLGPWEESFPVDRWPRWFS